MDMDARKAICVSGELDRLSSQNFGAGLFVALACPGAGLGWRARRSDRDARQTIAARFESTTTPNGVKFLACRSRFGARDGRPAAPTPSPAMPSPGSSPTAKLPPCLPPNWGPPPCSDLCASRRARPARISDAVAKVCPPCSRTGRHSSTPIPREPAASQRELAGIRRSNRLRAGHNAQAWEAVNTKLPVLASDERGAVRAPALDEFTS